MSFSAAGANQAATDALLFGNEACLAAARSVSGADAERAVDWILEVCDDSRPLGDEPLDVLNDGPIGDLAVALFETGWWTEPSSAVARLMDVQTGSITGLMLQLAQGRIARVNDGVHLPDVPAGVELFGEAVSLFEQRRSVRALTRVLAMATCERSSTKLVLSSEDQQLLERQRPARVAGWMQDLFSTAEGADIAVAVSEAGESWIRPVRWPDELSRELDSHLPEGLRRDLIAAGLDGRLRRGSIEWITTMLVATTVTVQALARVIATAGALVVAVAMSDRDEEPSSPDNGSGEIEVVPLSRRSELDDELSRAIVGSAIESLVQLVRPLTDEYGPVTGDDFLVLDADLRTLQDQARSPRPNPAILSAAIAEIVELVRPHLVRDDFGPVSELADQVIDEAAGLGLANDDLSGDAAQRMMQTVLETADEIEIEPFLQQFARRARSGALDGAEEGFKTLVSRMVVGAPGAVASLAAVVVYLFEIGSAPTVTAMMIVILRVIAGLYRRRG